MKNSWTQKEAIEFCILLEEFAPKAQMHVALTGGSLYKKGNRKDCDVLFYSVRQSSGINETRQELIDILSEIPGLKLGNVFGWMQKATYYEKPVDLFFPEHPFYQNSDAPY